MAKITLSLADRILKLKPIDDAWAADFNDKDTGLPLGINPFSLERIREGSGGFNVCVNTKKKSGAVLSGPHATIFDAWRAMLEAVEAWQQVKPVERVYFIGTALTPGRMIKVGRSFNPEGRLAQLQTAHGERLQIFATVAGGRGLEESYHRRWRIRRTNGEWFTIGDCIIKEIDRINAEVPA